jgi:hypothetical protein
MARGRERTFTRVEILTDSGKTWNLAYRYRRPRGFLRGGYGGQPRLIGLAGRILGFRVSRRSHGVGIRFHRLEQGCMRDLDGRRIGRDHNHAHAQPGCVEQVPSKIIGHPHAAVRGRIARQRAAVQR